MGLQGNVGLCGGLVNVIPITQYRFLGNLPNTEKNAKMSSDNKDFKVKD